MNEPIRGESGLRRAVSTRAASVGLSIGLGFIIAAGAFQTWFGGAL